MLAPVFRSVVLCLSGEAGMPNHNCREEGYQIAQSGKILTRAAL